MGFFKAQHCRQRQPTLMVRGAHAGTGVFIVSAMLTLALSACGGGGGSTASNPPVNVVINTPTPTTSLASASGIITSDSPQVPAFSPRRSDERSAQAFTTVVGQGVEVYTFQNSIQGPDSNGNSTGLAIQIFRFSSVNGQLADASYTEITYENSVPKRLVRTCGDPCTGLSARKITSGNGTSFGISINLQNVKLVGDPANSSVANRSCHL